MFCWGCSRNTQHGGPGVAEKGSKKVWYCSTCWIQFEHDSYDAEHRRSNICNTSKALKSCEAKVDILQDLFRKAQDEDEGAQSALVVSTSAVSRLASELERLQKLLDETKAAKVLADVAFQKAVDKSVRATSTLESIRERLRAKLKHKDDAIMAHQVALGKMRGSGKTAIPTKADLGGLDQQELALATKYDYNLLKPQCLKLQSHENLADVLDSCVEEHAPRVIWTYWHQGAEEIPYFNALCIQTWRTTNPRWRVVIVNSRNIWQLLKTSDLPARWKSNMALEYRADCVRLALLRKYGGIYMDSSIVVTEDLTDLTKWESAKEDAHHFVAFYIEFTDCVENYFLACRRDSPLITSWHQTWLQFWHTRIPECPGSSFLGDLRLDPFFKGVDLSHISDPNYLVQHACYKKLLDLNAEFARWHEQAHLHSAGSIGGALWLHRCAKESALARMKSAEEVDEIVEHLLETCDETEAWDLWHKYAIGQAMYDKLLGDIDHDFLSEVAIENMPLAKFPGGLTSLDRQWISIDMILGRRSILQKLFAKALTQQHEGLCVPESAQDAQPLVDARDTLASVHASPVEEEVDGRDTSCLVHASPEGEEVWNLTKQTYYASTTTDQVIPIADDVLVRQCKGVFSKAIGDLRVSEKSLDEGKLSHRIDNKGLAFASDNPVKLAADHAELLQTKSATVDSFSNKLLLVMNSLEQWSKWLPELDSLSADRDRLIQAADNILSLEHTDTLGTAEGKSLSAQNSQEEQGEHQQSSMRDQSTSVVDESVARQDQGESADGSGIETPIVAHSSGLEKWSDQIDDMDFVLATTDEVVCAEDEKLVRQYKGAFSQTLNKLPLVEGETGSSAVSHDTTVASMESCMVSLAPEILSSNIAAFDIDQLLDEVFDIEKEYDEDWSEHTHQKPMLAPMMVSLPNPPVAETAGMIDEQCHQIPSVISDNNKSSIREEMDKLVALIMFGESLHRIDEQCQRVQSMVSDSSESRVREHVDKLVATIKAAKKSDIHSEGDLRPPLTEHPQGVATLSTEIAGEEPIPCRESRHRSIAAFQKVDADAMPILVCVLSDLD